jgi:heptosyltransferase-1
VLLVQISAMGDQVQTLPAVSDILARWPGLELHWAVDRRFAEIPRMHPGVREVHALPLKEAQQGRPGALRDLLRQVRALRARGFDLVWDPQSVLKSALVARLARLAPGGLRVGYRAADCGGEPLAACLFDRHYARPPGVHGTPGRRLFAQAVFDTDASGPPRYGLREAFGGRPPGAGDSPSPYAVLAHGASKPEKLWPQDHWRALGECLLGRGLRLVLPWGSEDEKARAQALIAAWPPGAASLAARGGLTDMAWLLAGASLVVGVDSGFSHLAAALARPLLMLFTSTGPELFSPELSSLSVTLGGHGQVPSAALACDAALGLLRAHADPQTQTA